MEKNVLGLIFLLCSTLCQATICPDPQTTSLKWGEPPEPWIVNPYANNPPQGDGSLSFVRANILVAGYGLGVACTYQSTDGMYSIFWPVQTKIPARVDYRWIRVPGGYVCTQGLAACEFFVAG